MQAIGEHYGRYRLHLPERNVHGAVPGLQGPAPLVAPTQSRRNLRVSLIRCLPAWTAG